MHFSKVPCTKGTKVWGAADGVKLHIEASCDDRVQNCFYNRWQHRHFINAVYVFAPDGRIRIAVVNAPGTWHDSTIADYGVYEQIDEMYDKYGGSIVVDSAFQLGDRPCLLKSAQLDPIGEHKQVAENCAATSVRQLSEWGMRMIQAQFPRLKDSIQYEEAGERRIILHLMMLIYNFSCSDVRINQILNTYMEQNMEEDQPVNYYNTSEPIEETADHFLNKYG